jgi:UDP-2,4-diacetamido-2,4,6-trideoxy-beta-L-altropyranose hydrolase
VSLVVGFVTHCGPKVGLGHLRRCLTLAQALKDQGAEVEFILGDDPHGLATTHGHGFSARAVPIHDGREVCNALRAARPAVVVADSYDLAAQDFQALSQIAPVVALDDLADRALPVALLWNGGIQAERIDYAPHVLPHTRLLLGPEYALLAPEYRRLPARIIRDTVEQVLVTVGGADPAGALEPLFHATRRGCPTAKVDVVLGPYVPLPTSVQEDDVVIHRSLPSLLPILQKVDLAVSAGGQTTYELAASGTPAVVTWTADNQQPQVLEFERRGTLSAAGGVREGAQAEDRISALVRALASHAEARRIMSQAGQACLDGQGAARTAAAVLSL